MKSAVETLSPTRAKLRVEVPFDELKPSLDAAYKEIAQQINVPGFRRGKVPPIVIDRQVGRGAVLDQAINDLLPKAYTDALQANELTPLGQPDIEMTRFEDNDGFEFTAEVDIVPAFEVPDYAGIEAQVDDIEVTDADVEERVQELRERLGVLADVDRPVADGDFVTIDLAASAEDQPIEGAQVEGMSYQVGSGGMLDGLDEALIGMSAGEEKTFTSQLLAGGATGQDVDVLVKVGGVQERELPEADDDLAQQSGEFDTYEELVADLRGRIEHGKRLGQAISARDAVLEALLEKVEVPVPESLVTAELASRRQELNQQLLYAGMTMDDYLAGEETTLEEFEADLERRIRDAVVAQFVLDKIARTEEISLGQDDLSQHLVRRAQQSGQDPQSFVNHMVEHNHIPELAQEVLRGKALAKIVEGAVVTDASGNVVPVAALQAEAEAAALGG